jgi:hypothetical protein
LYALKKLERLRRREVEKDRQEEFTRKREQGGGRGREEGGGGRREEGGGRREEGGGRREEGGGRRESRDKVRRRGRGRGHTFSERHPWGSPCNVKFRKLIFRRWRRSTNLNPCPKLLNRSKGIKTTRQAEKKKWSGGKWKEVEGSGGKGEKKNPRA